MRLPASTHHRQFSRLVSLAFDPAPRVAQDTHMLASFHQTDRRTFRRVMIAGFLLCAAFVAISFTLRPQPDPPRALVKADRLVRTAGEPQRMR